MAGLAAMFRSGRGMTLGACGLGGMGRMRLVRRLSGIFTLAFHDTAEGGAHASAEEVGDFAFDAFGALVLGRSGRRFLLVRLRLVGATVVMVAVGTLVVRTALLAAW
jgi:hypothetical protein